MSLDRVPQRKIGSNLVAISTTLANSLDVPSFFQVGNDALHRALRDAYQISNIAHSRGRLPRNAQEDVRVIGKERPVRLPFPRGPSLRRPRSWGFLAASTRCRQWVTSCIQSTLAFLDRACAARKGHGNNPRAP